jgi:dTMP kinase
VSHSPHVELPTPPQPTYPGTFIAFEGGEGAGKSTQVQALGQYLAGATATDREVVLTREPGGTPAAEAIREVVLHPRYAGLDARAEALLFAAARGEHVRAVIMPALQRGAVVVCDRYLDSSVAYQGIARGLGRDLIEGFSLWAAGGLVPDLTVVLDVDEATGLGRVAAPDRLESESVEFHRLVRRAFLGLAARAPHRYLVLDSGQDRAAIAAQVAERVDALLPSRPTSEPSGRPA